MQGGIRTTAARGSWVEVCMGMGIPIPMGFPWDSHGNGSSFGLLIGMGMGMGMRIVLMGMETAYFIGENKIAINVEQ